MIIRSTHFVAVTSSLLCLSRSNISSVVYYDVRVVLSRDSDDSVIFESLCVAPIQAGEFSTVKVAIYAITVVDLLFF